MVWRLYYEFSWKHSATLSKWKWKLHLKWLCYKSIFNWSTDNYQMKILLCSFLKITHSMRMNDIQRILRSKTFNGMTWMPFIPFHFQCSRYTHSSKINIRKICFTFMFTVVSNCSLDSAALRYIHFVALYFWGKCLSRIYESLSRHQKEWKYSQIRITRHTQNERNG